MYKDYFLCKLNKTLGVVYLNMTVSNVTEKSLIKRVCLRPKNYRYTCYEK